MNFCSDNVTGFAPEILEALARANQGPAMPYGDDALTAKVERRFAEIFEREVAVFLVATGSSANALALSCLTPPFGAIYSHPAAHVAVDECGAPEFYSGGAKMVGVHGAHGKIAAADLDKVLAASGRGMVHHVQAAAVSLTQATEAGTIYRPDEIARDRRGRAAAQGAPPYGRRALRQCAGGAECEPGRPHLARRGGRALLRRHRRTARWPRRRWFSSTRASPPRCPIGASAQAISSRRCGSSPRSSTPISRTISGCATPRHANAEARRLSEGLGQAARRTAAASGRGERNFHCAAGAGHLGAGAGRVQILPLDGGGAGHPAPGYRVQHRAGPCDGVCPHGGEAGARLAMSRRSSSARAGRAPGTPRARRATPPPETGGTRRPRPLRGACGWTAPSRTPPPRSPAGWWD